MPGGIGPVDAKCAEACRRTYRDIRLPASADETSILYNLSMNRVHYVPQRDSLYFADSSYVQVSEIVASVLRGMGSEARIEQLHLDKRGVFKAGKRIVLTAVQASAVLAALRLRGIRLTISA